MKLIGTISLLDAEQELPGAGTRFPGKKNECESIITPSVSIARSCSRTPVMQDIFSGFSVTAGIVGRETSGSEKPIKINVPEDDCHT